MLFQTSQYNSFRIQLYVKLYYNAFGHDTSAAWYGVTFFWHGTARLIGLPRPTYLLVLSTAKKLGTAARVPMLLHLPYRAEKNGTRTNQFMCPWCPGCPVTYEQALIRWISHL